ncbi:tRNA pseudouridine synthase-like 1 [Thrips palmi]|uniref:tRNA pseudouridine synthase n=1 Tax=Thrips palmi TaxID=161013 RepID=A0A6P8ZDP4_THRPL|nr:tRNA pseudouridine synthase-like 1 [Thrips palmi]
MSFPARARYLLSFSYIGSPFNASARTSKDIDLTTVIGCLERAFHNKRKKLGIDDISPLVISSRTDRRVHALLNTAHVDFTVEDKCYSANNLLTTVNYYFRKRHLPLRIISIQQVSQDFNARTWAKQRSYLYRIAVPKAHCENEAIPISEVDRCFFLSVSNFNIEAVEEVLSIFPGVHDFSSFSGKPSRALVDRTPIRHVDSCCIRRGNALMPLLYEPSINNFDFWDFIIEGRSFLYRQVRRMVAAAIAVGLGRLSVADVRRSLELSTPIPLSRPVAPAYGLYLAKVTYKKEDLLVNRTTYVNQEYKKLVNLLDEYKLSLKN